MENQPSAIIRLENITKKFPGVVALDGINLSIYPGEVHAIIGENGAGKTTLIKVLVGLIQKDAGSVRILGMDLDRQAEAIRQVEDFNQADAARPAAAPNRTPRERFLWRKIAEKFVALYQSELDWVRQLREELREEFQNEHHP